MFEIRGETASSTTTDAVAPDPDPIPGSEARKMNLLQRVTFFMESFDSMVISMFWPIAYPIIQIKRDLPVPLIAYGLDSVPWPAVKVLMFLTVLMTQPDFEEYGTRVRLTWALISYVGVVPFWSGRFFSLYLQSGHAGSDG